MKGYILLLITFISCTMEKHTNALINETSPYLLQHAHNPVNWYAWNEETLALAEKEDKLILLSIGYSSCHWCHVMEKECFEDEEVANLMNEHFINIKVDREERPDVDAIYMEAVQSMGLGGGWPLNVFLTPDQRPFYGGTYFPKEKWMNVLTQINMAYETRRDEIEKSANSLTEALNSSLVKRMNLDQDHAIDISLLHEAVTAIMPRMDTIWGGQQRAPKFPMPSIWNNLLYYYLQTGNDEVKETIIRTLDKMAAGGIYDHVGGGFARYSVDGYWHVPHFEKMLYDNAQLISLYADAYTHFGKERYREVVDETIAFLQREMKSEDGGYYSALDADSEGVEGKFYTWSKEELENILSEDEQWVIDYFQVTEAGNWEETNVLWHATASSRGENWPSIRQKLLTAREKRIRPGLDDKIVTGWNGLLLTGLVKAYLASGDEKILSSAQDLATFIKNRLHVNDTLYRTYKNGEVKTKGFLEDYAAVIQGFIHLYEADFDKKRILFAKVLTDQTVEEFYDASEGYFNFTSSSATNLITTKKELYDNVIPASNSIMAENLVKMGRIFSDKDYLRMATAMTDGMGPHIKSDMLYLSQWAYVYQMLSYPAAEIAIVGKDYRQMRLEFTRDVSQNLVFSGTLASDTLPLLENRNAIDGRTTVYVCFDSYCKVPVFDAEAAKKQIMEEFERIN